MRFPAVLLVFICMSTLARAEDMINLKMDDAPAEKASGAPAENAVYKPPVDKNAVKTTAASLSASDKGELKRVEAYLGAIKTISSGFSQVSPDGGVSNGHFYLQRPGKMRMEYDPPVPVLVVTNGGNMVYYDKELDQVTHIPLSSSLVNFLTRDHIVFDNTVIITHFEHGNGIMRISIVQSEKPKDGMMTLEFSDSPLTLRNIIVTDSGGQSTTVSLADAHFDTPLDSSLFIFKDPHLSGKGHFKR